MNNVKDKNIQIMEQNKENLRTLEEFYVNGTVGNVITVLEEMKKQKTEEMIKYADEHSTPILDRNGNIVGNYVKMNPLVINNYFFKTICPLNNKVPMYNAEQLGLLFEYYLSLITEVNDKIGTFPSSLSSFCKLAGISTSTLHDYRDSADIEMRNVVEKIYDQIGDENITMSQLGMAKERTTIFKMKSQHEMTEKVEPRINYSVKQVINTNQIEGNIEKYKKMIGKK